MTTAKAASFGVLLLLLVASAGATVSDAAGRPGLSPSGGPLVLTPDDFTYETIDVPGATRTAVFGVNAQGAVVGRHMTGGVWRGFVLQAGVVTDIVYPGASGTAAYGINSRGDVAGTAVVGGKNRGFVLSDGAFIDVTIEGATEVFVYAINDSGMVLGRTDTYANFLWRGGTYEILALPPVKWAEGLGLNSRGEVAGHFVADGDATNHMVGFTYWHDVFRAVDYPEPNVMACFQGLGDTGEAVGHVQLGAIVYGTMWRHDRFTATLRYPGAAGTYPRALAPGGVVYGYYLVGGIPHGFVARPLQ